ncbi:MAG: DUF2625 family protein [Planctomycetes bacterium]|nr:DUF2625 family protein [Planctomycetota bacterium]
MAFTGSCSRSSDAMSPKTIEQLVDTTEPGMALVHEWIKDAKSTVEVLGVDPAAGRRTLLALQVTSRSPMGAIALESGGLLIDSGWVRVLGGGHDRLPRSLNEWNRLEQPPHRLPGALLVGDDAIGGFFALNGGGIPGPVGHVFYFAPDSLRWEDVAASYSEWLRFLMLGDLERFYADNRWGSWRVDVQQMPGDRAFSIYPFPFAEGPPVGERSRRPVPLEELWGLYVVDLPKQLGR